MKWVLQKFRGKEGPVINWHVGFEELKTNKQKTKPKHVIMAWIYYKKTSDSVPYNCTENYLKTQQKHLSIFEYFI